MWSGQTNGGSSESICFLFAHANCVVCEIPVESGGRNYFLNFLINAPMFVAMYFIFRHEHNVIALGRFEYVGN